jgi:CubicO group peptidase (beta-lactamase class C family)
MQDLTVTPTRHDFADLHAGMQKYVDGDLLAGVSSAVLRGRELVDVHCAGWADREQRVPLRTDHIFRAFSSTKLITSCAALLLHEEGRIDLDEPVQRYLPQLADRRVLRPGAASLDDSEPARSPITLRHLLTHSAGLSYGIFDPGTPMFKGYNERRVRHPETTLAEMMDALAPLPLSFHPGTGWEYSVATDVVSRLVEVLGGETFDRFIERRILAPLGMDDTAFVVPEGKRDRFVAYYAGADLMDPMKPGLTRTDDSPYRGAYLKPWPMLSGGGGLVTTLHDQVALIRSLLPGGPTLLKAATIEMAMRNHLPHGQCIDFLGRGQIPGKAYGLIGAVTLKPSSIDPPDSTDEVQWGGIAGTHWWISPKRNLAGLVMAQRQLAFWHPFAFDLKRRVYRAMS